MGADHWGLFLDTPFSEVNLVWKFCVLNVRICQLFHFLSYVFPAGLDKQS